MKTRSCIVVDETSAAVGEALQKMCDAIDQAVSDYITILNGITKTAALKGNTTERYLGYADLAKALQGEFSHMSRLLSFSMSEFIRAVNDADQYLY